MLEAAAAEVPTVLNRKARRTLQIRQQLIDGARTLISERGVDRLRVRDLAAAADVALGTFYNHFETMDELVAAVASDSLETLADSLVPLTHAEPDPAVTACAAAIRPIRIAYDDPELARLVINLEHADRLFTKTMIPYVRVVLEQGVAAGRFDVPDVETASIMLAGGGLALIRAILDGVAAPDAHLAHAAAVLSFLGIPPDEAVTLIADHDRPRAESNQH